MLIISSAALVATAAAFLAATSSTAAAEAVTSFPSCNLGTKFFNSDLTDIYVQFGSNLGSVIPSRIKNLLSATGLTVREIKPRGGYDGDEEPSIVLTPGHLELSFGNASRSLELISLDDIPAEGFRVISAQTNTGAGYAAAAGRSSSSTPPTPGIALASNGQPLDRSDGYSSALNPDDVHYGAVVGAYAMLELLGFGFLHPLQPIIPSKEALGINLQNAFTTCCETFDQARGKNIKCSDDGRAKGMISFSEAPYWPRRTWHVHTQHPLEFTDVLNGFDIPMFPAPGNNTDTTATAAATTTTTTTSSDSGVSTGSGADPSSPLLRCIGREESGYCESWESMFESLDGLFEWLVANRQNRVEVLLLGSAKWDAYGGGGDYASGPERQGRLRSINRLAHGYGLLIGADIPIANRQQHGWKMINLQDDFEQQSADIRDRVDWAFAAEYDFISTESGLSEFTKPSCDLMLALFNVFTDHVVGHWKREALTKVHCSTSQFCNEVDEVTGALKYPDPRTGEPINFNFLPTYAMAGLGVMPHTVQVYSFDDPSANSYGNQNFTYMSDYMTWEAGLGKRTVLYYAETSYWVNVDVDVPLFLPLSGQRRLYDLRRTARLEQQQGFRIDGQMNFESGWEFGYYLSNVLTARAVWNPHLEVEDEWEAFRAALQDALPATLFSARSSGVSGVSGNSDSNAGSQLAAGAAELAAKVHEQLVMFSKMQAAQLIFSKTVVTDTEGKGGSEGHGEVEGNGEYDYLLKLSGHAYMSGSDTWVDLERALGLSITQPDKIHLQETDDPQWEQMLALLAQLEASFNEQAALFAALADTARDDFGLTGSMLNVLEEFADCVQIAAYRAQHNSILYTAQDLLRTSSISPTAFAIAQDTMLHSSAVNSNSSSTMTTPATTITAAETAFEQHGGALLLPPAVEAERAELLLQGRALLSEAQEVMDRRVSAFRVPQDRIAGWRQGPTVYHFGYVWAASSLYYLWRDQGIVEARSLLAAASPCYLNRHEAVELAFGVGKAIEQVLRIKLLEFGASEDSVAATVAAMLADCLAPPLKEIKFPRDL